MSAPAFDALLRSLVAAEVKFVLIGGLAVNAWGVIRGTKDVDIVIATDEANRVRLAEAAVALNGHVELKDALLGTAFSIAGRLGSGERVNIETKLGSLDVVQGLPGVSSYDELKTRSKQAEILGVEVAVCSLSDLRDMKRAAGRTRDLADLEDLDEAHR